MDTSRNDQLGELAADASLERSDFLVTASAQLTKFLDANRERISGLGGLVLIDDEVDYLAIAADLTFRSRSRYLDEATGKWVSETETIDNPSELIELYNLADVFAAFAEATKAEAGLEEEPTATDELLKSADIAPSETVSLGGENPYAAAADDWAAAGRVYEEAPENEEEAAERLYDLARTFQERIVQKDALLIEQFEYAAAPLAAVLGSLFLTDEEDERVTLLPSGSFVAEVVPLADEGVGEWQRLTTPDQLAEFFDASEVVGRVEEYLADRFPAIEDLRSEDEPEDEPEPEPDANDH
jgi:hypothetical protein